MNKPGLLKWAPTIEIGKQGRRWALLSFGKSGLQAKSFFECLNHGKACGTEVHVSLETVLYEGLGQTECVRERWEAEQIESATVCSYEGRELDYLPLKTHTHTHRITTSHFCKWSTVVWSSVWNTVLFVCVSLAINRRHGLLWECEMCGLETEGWKYENLEVLPLLRDNIVMF